MLHRLSRLFAVLFVLSLAGGPTAALADPPRQEGDGLLRYDQNPVLTVGEAGEWDSDYIAVGDVMFDGDQYHLFYSGSTAALVDPMAIGHATSPDGKVWTKDEANPVLVGGDADPQNPLASLTANTVLMEGDAWVMYLTIHPRTGSYRYSKIVRATADSPSGPWVVDPTPVVEQGESRRWDTDWVAWPDVVPTDEGAYAMYFIGCCARGQNIGLATSLDGIHWEKYDDPATTERIFSDTDAVLQVGPVDAWDHGAINQFDVWQDDAGWHMLYDATDDDFGYGAATSPDGIVWTTSASNPLWIIPLPDSASPLMEGPLAVIPGDDMLYVYGDFILDGSAREINLGFLTPPSD